jgi:hypothetical protein
MALRRKSARPWHNEAINHVEKTLFALATGNNVVGNARHGRSALAHARLHRTQWRQHKPTLFLHDVIENPCIGFRFCIAVVAIDGALCLYSPALAWLSADKTLEFLFEFLTVIPTTLVLMGLLDVWAPRQLVENNLGSKSGVRGIALASAAGHGRGRAAVRGVSQGLRPLETRNDSKEHEPARFRRLPQWPVAPQGSPPGTVYFLGRRLGISMPYFWIL